MKRYILLLGLLVSILFGRGYILIDGGGSQGIGTSSHYPGTWSDSAFKWALSKVGYSKNFVVVYYENYNASWWTTYLRGLGHTGSVKVVVVRNTNDANNPSKWTDVYSEGTGIIWFPGGDQSNYVPILKNTKLGDTIKTRYNRGEICVGGTSAGAMIIGEYVSTGGAWPNEAIRDPYNSYMSYDRNVLGLLENCLVETHLAERGRLGRMFAHLGRIKNDYGEEISVIGLDDCTALCIDSDLSATVIGSGSVTILKSTPSTNWGIASGRPVNLTNLWVLRAHDRFKINLNTGEIISIPPTARAINQPSPQIVPPPSEIYLIGGKPDQISDQNTALSQFISACGPSPVLTLFAANVGMDTVVNYKNRLISLGASQVYLVPLTSSDVNNPTYAQYVQNSQGFVFLKNDLQNAGSLLNSNNLVAQSYRERINEGVPQLFIGLDCMLINDSVLYNVESNDYNAYYGDLRMSKGLNLVPGLVVAPAAFVPENTSPSYVYLESKVDGHIWLLTRYPGSVLLLLEGASYEYSNDETWVKIGRDGIMRGYRGAKGAPLVILDALNNQYSAISTWTMRSSSSGPRQNGTLTPLVIHVIDTTFQFDLLNRGTLDVSVEAETGLNFDLQILKGNILRLRLGLNHGFEFAKICSADGKVLWSYYIGKDTEKFFSFPKREGIYFLLLEGKQRQRVVKILKFN
uniref:Cyanophycinase n=1 Tax=candidate division WOR-3 bacterium TaxID=2052148 RepID=A0A7V4E468_UNCW3